MSKSSFLDQVLAGDKLITEIDDFVDAWHEGDSSLELRQCIGMTADEYALWLQSPDMLAVICAARRYQQPLAEAVNDNVHQRRMAARSGEGAALKRLEAWLRREGKID